jgi:hypothetical protein
MVNKLVEIQATITANLCDIAVITESWLTYFVSSQLITIPGYSVIRSDRPNDQRGGGLCTYISSNLDYLEF